MLMAGDGKKKMAALIIERMGSEANQKAYNDRAKEPEGEEVDEGLLAAAEEVQAAMGKDPKELALALKNFFYLCDAMPHEEAEHEEEEEKPSILG